MSNESIAQREAKFPERLKLALEDKQLRQADLAKRTGIDRSMISSYLSGRYKPSSDNIHKIAVALDISEGWLLGYDVPWEAQWIPAWNKDMLKIGSQTLPMLGKVSCGMPIYCDEEFTTVSVMGDDIKADCCLRAVGDSMINARIHDGDIVFIRYQPIVEMGEIAAVVVDDEITLKRCYYYPESNKLILQAENPAYAPLVYVGSELDTIHILGKAVAFQSLVK